MENLKPRDPEVDDDDIEDDSKGADDIIDDAEAEIAGELSAKTSKRNDDDDDDDDDFDPAIEELGVMEDQHVKTHEMRIINPNERRSSSIASEYELTDILSTRATQIQKYRNSMVDVDDLDDPKKMAMREISKRKVPLLIRRVVGEIMEGTTKVQYVEIWNPNLMVHAITFK